MRNLPKGWARIKFDKEVVKIEERPKLNILNILAITAVTIISVAIAFALAYYTIDYFENNMIMNIIVWTFYYVSILRFAVKYILYKKKKPYKNEGV